MLDSRLVLQSSCYLYHTLLASPFLKLVYQQLCPAGVDGGSWRVSIHISILRALEAQQQRRRATRDCSINCFGKWASAIVGESCFAIAWRTFFKVWTNCIIIILVSCKNTDSGDLPDLLHCGLDQGGEGQKGKTFWTLKAWNPWLCRRASRQFRFPRTMTSGY